MTCLAKFLIGASWAVMSCIFCLLLFDFIASFTSLPSLSVADYLASRLSFFQIVLSNWHECLQLKFDSVPITVLIRPNRGDTSEAVSVMGGKAF